jgi:hypothetical protein
MSNIKAGLSRPMFTGQHCNRESPDIVYIYIYIYIY